MVSLIHAYGFSKSVLIANLSPGLKSRMNRLYDQFIRPGDLCFDIGAHVGSRIRAWSQLDARIVAVEPDPLCQKALKRWYGKKANVVILDTAIASKPGNRELFVNRQKPKLTSLMPDWETQIGQGWIFSLKHRMECLTVTTKTLDILIKEYGEPAFCKIDVEGYEREALQGLSRAIKYISFEYMPPAIAIALSCVDRLQELGEYEFNWSGGEAMVLGCTEWVDSAKIKTILNTKPGGYRSGDVYARRIHAR